MLIVLGMLAFMVISAVAFSAYMRYSRLPSSYLRRSSASRLLVKAALAEAIDEIDSAIGNNPHPGIGTASYTFEDDSNRRDRGQAVMRNTWKNRIYLGTNNVNNLLSPDDEKSGTVSTLCLEGLAYIPPALVNDARYYSRRSRAGCWKNLAFDSGRYAFCAIDVSDYLNINALQANVARSASADRRVSLAYLFENDGHTSASGSAGSPSSWDEFMANYTGGGKVPLVSLADFNLALYDKKPNGWTSVFCDYVKKQSPSYYGGISAESPEADKIRRQAFVTDSYFPEGEEHNGQGGAQDHDHLDLDEATGQPFSKDELRMNLSFHKVADGHKFKNTVAIDTLERSLNELGKCALYDYLDADDVPVSLAFPTTERVPMVCGLSPDFAQRNLSVTVKREPENEPAYENETAATRTAKRTVVYSVSGLSACNMDALLVFPFRHKDDRTDSRAYKVDGRMTYFFTVDGAGVGLRTSSPGDLLHFSADPDMKDVTEVQSKDNVVCAVAVPLTASSDVRPSDFATDSGESGAVKRMRLQPSAPWTKEIKFLTVNYEWTQTATEDAQGTKTWEPLAPTKNDIKTAEFHAGPLKADATAAADQLKDAVSFLKGNAQLKMTLSMAVWARVRNPESKTVDLVPASAKDDLYLGNTSDKMSYQYAQNQWGDGNGYPLLRLDLSGADALEVNPDGDVESGVVAVGGNPALKLDQPTILTGDPRYNYAPENWFTTADSLSENLWLQKCGRENTANDRRDGDIFMSVSDQEELQSVFELANVPRLTNLNADSRWGKSGTYVRPLSKGYTSLPTDLAGTANHDNMWRTYDPFDRYQTGGDNFEGIGFHASCEGYKLTPYSTQTNVMMAAFANTPHEWRFSSANEDTMQSIPDDAQGFNAKYAWNAYSSGAKIDWADLEDLCGAFMEEIRASNGNHWEDVWADLDWIDVNRTGDEQSKYLIGDLQLAQDRIWNCDRKFLYGFWHDCFELKQQLFLVFVRAEPTMMGGGAIGQTPPQLGARAVALVWRDPTASTATASGPHQTRILFYRQFD